MSHRTLSAPPFRRRLSLLLLHLAAVASAAVGASGCLVLHLWPLYGEDAIEFEEALLGTWENREDEQTLRVDRAEWRSYTVTWTEGSATRTATAHLTSLGAHRYLDLMPQTGEDRGPLLVPVHAIARVRLDDGRLHVELLDYDWLSAPARQPLLPPGGFVTGEREELLLTVATPRLRRWVQRISGEAGAFGPPRVFVRGAAEPEPQAEAGDAPP
jgi:hypothetical protein